MQQSHLELLKSAKDNAELSFEFLEYSYEGLDNLFGKKSLSLTDVLLNVGQVAVAGGLYTYFGNAAIEDVKQIGENVSIEIERMKKPVIKRNNIIFDMQNPLLRNLYMQSQRN